MYGLIVSKHSAEKRLQGYVGRVAMRVSVDLHLSLSLFMPSHDFDVYMVQHSD